MKIKQLTLLLFAVFASTLAIGQVQTTNSKLKQPADNTTAKPLGSSGYTSSQQQILKMDVLAEDMKKSVELSQAVSSSDRSSYSAALQKRKEHNKLYAVKLKAELAKHRQGTPSHSAIQDELNRIAADLN